MKSLFSKIFSSFLLAFALIGASLVVLALTANQNRAALGRNKEKLTELGRQMEEIHRSAGSLGLQNFKKGKALLKFQRFYLFKDGKGPLSGDKDSSRTSRRLVKRASATGEIEISINNRRLWAAVPLDDDYLIIARMPPPTRLRMLLNPHYLGLRLGVVFIISAAVCWLLARSLSNPIKKLREATQKLAAGDLNARVGENHQNSTDEISQLGCDFDRMADRIQSLIALRQRLFTDISHELRSPLARLNVALELARKNKGQAAASSLDRIELESDRLDELIGRLLELTKLEADMECFERTIFNMDEILERVVRDAHFEAQGKGKAVLQLSTCPAQIYGMPDLVQSALENVIRNAVRFTAEESSVEVNSKMISLENGAKAVETTVRDHGPGVPEDEVEDIFTPFYRVAAARDRQSGGVGMGLAIAERAVRLHGGTIKAENAKDGGLLTTIVLKLV